MLRVMSEAWPADCYFILRGTRLLFQSFKHRELGRCQGAEAAVWSQVIVILTPCGEDCVPASPNQNLGTPAS